MITYLMWNFIAYLEDENISEICAIPLFFLLVILSPVSSILDILLLPIELFISIFSYFRGR